MLVHKYNFDLLKSMGIKIKGYLPHIHVDKEDKKIVSSFLRNAKLNKFVVLCPSATTPAKTWPKEKFKDFIINFNQKYPNYKILISVAPNEKELADFLCKSNEKFCFPLVGFNLRRLKLIFDKARFVVANDGGVREIASVSKTNVIALCGPADLKMHIPFRYFKILHHRLPCYPCDWSKPCTKPYGKWCMDLITVNELLTAIRPLMKDSS